MIYSYDKILQVAWVYYSRLFLTPVVPLLCPNFCGQFSNSADIVYPKKSINQSKMSSIELNPKPVRVSALIKFGRWGMLTAGIAYGLFHQNRLGKKEAAWREVETKRKAIRDKQIAIEKKIAAEAEMASLEAMMK